LGREQAGSGVGGGQGELDRWLGVEVRAAAMVGVAVFRWWRAVTAWTTARGDSERRANACA